MSRRWYRPACLILTVPRGVLTLKVWPVARLFSWMKIAPCERVELKTLWSSVTTSNCVDSSITSLSSAISIVTEPPGSVQNPSPLVTG
jgi:hypothetical protein